MLPLETLAVTAALACVAILAARILGAISLRVPLQLETSGAEWRGGSSRSAGAQFIEKIIRM